MKIQCLYYALDKWNESGGYIQFRKSTHWCMPHALHYDPKTKQLTHYVPPDDLKYPWHSMFGFEGYIKTVDEEDCAPMTPMCMLFGTIALTVFGGLWLINRTAIRRNRRRYERRAQSRTGVDRRRVVK